MITRLRHSTITAGVKAATILLAAAAMMALATGCSDNGVDPIVVDDTLIVVPDTLLVDYALDDNAIDESGHDNDGIVYGATATSGRLGRAGRALSFDGVNDYIEIPGTADKNLTSGFSLVAWVKYDHCPDNAIVAKHVRASNNGFAIGVTDNKFICYVNSDTRLSSADTYNDGQWHFVVGTYDGAKQYLYVDGGLKAAQDMVYTNTNDSNITIGKAFEGSYFKGVIDDVRIYTVPLSASAIDSIYEAEAGLIAYWSMDEVSGTAVADASGNGLDGVAYGADIVADGAHGSARSFNGTTDYIEVPDDELLDLDDEITVSMWVRLGTPYTEGFLISKRVQGGGINYLIKYVHLSAGNDVLAFQYGEGDAVGYRIDTDIGDGNWHHVAFSYVFQNPSTALWMIDGTVVDGEWRHGDGTPGGGTEPVYTNDFPLQIGRQLSSSPGYMRMAADEVRVYNRTLSEAEIAEIYSE